MIERLDIENLKSFAGRHQIELAPITLVYGPNSSGKSTVLQSLAVLKQTVEPLRSRIDFEEPPIGLHGELVDLGSFSAAINRHDLSKHLTVGIRFVDDQDLPRKAVLGRLPLYVSLGFKYDVERDVPVLATSTVGDDERRVSFIPKPVAKNASVAALGKTAFRLDRSTSNSLISLVNARAAAIGRSGDKAIAIAPAENWTWFAKRLQARLSGQKPILFYGPGLFPAYPDPELVAGGRFNTFQMFDEIWGMRARAIEDIVLGLTYLGPLRAAPKRFELLANELPTNVGPSGANTSVLLARDEELCSEVNGWLTRLDIPYQLDAKQIGRHELDFELGDVIVTTLRDARNGITVTPQDVGFGISQLLPVIVQALVGTDRITCVEQPEIHIHPRLQAEVADLLIAAVGPGRNNQLIVETHSEHLMLRLQRRLREGNPQWLTPRHIAVLYVDPDKHGNASVSRLRLDDEGYFEDPWPSGFFAERLDELMQS